MRRATELIRDRRYVYSRMLVDEACRIIDLIVDNQIQILLASVFRDVRVGKFFGHIGGDGFVNLMQMCSEVGEERKLRKRC